GFALRLHAQSTSSDAKGFRFVGLDLPIVVQEMEPIIRSLAANPERVSFCGVDATNYESLAAALQNIDEPLCITTEGMIMYFTENEVETVIANVRNLLEVHGGCWITPDPEFKLQFILTFRSVFGENSLAKLATTGNVATKQSNVANLSNSFIVDARTGSLKAAQNLLAKHGLKAERINLAEHMPELSVYRQLTSKQILQFKEAMRNCHYWIITLDEMRKPQTIQRQNPFEMNHKLANGILRIKLRGRVDSISAPKILLAWEAEKIAGVIDGVEIDCAELDYISSAGIRVLSDMQKNCGRGVAFFNVNSSVAEILSQNGFK
ncbi:MAG: anti-sigma factor antagonist, partial [Selenomonadaceae bacterium]|nr:anti-sigma factor antagonist [Selenomonadaceae bacterium]